MRSEYFVILGLAGTLMLGACSSSAPDNRKAQANSTAPANLSDTTATTTSGNSNTVVVSNGMVVAPQPADANAALNASSDQSQPLGPLANVKRKLNSSGGANVDAATLAMKNAKPAPDNSTFTSYLTDAGYEVRTFRNHPQLLKAVKRTASDGSQTIKVFLRSGKVVDLPGTAIPFIASAPAEVIAGAAGIQAPAPKQPAPGSTGSKKSSN